MNDMFDGKVALVTGGASGIGRSIASALASGGAGVVIADIDDGGAATVAAGLARAAAVHCDVGDPHDISAAVEAAVEKFGRLDILVNNAGIEVTAPLLELTQEQLERILRVNVTSVFNGIKFAAPHIAESGGGSIISIASVAGLRGVPVMGAYAATKAAVINLSQTAALELRPMNIRVNCICPGLIDTPMLSQMKAGFEGLFPVPIDELIRGKQGRYGKADDIARAVSYLASEQADFLSGVIVPVDNAMSASLF